MSHHKSSSSITTYNSNLEFVSKVGQSDVDAPFYMSKSIGSFLVNDEYFMINDKMKGQDVDMITIINRSDGKIRKKFKIRYFYVWCFYLNKYIITFNNETHTLITHDFEGNVVSEMKFEDNLVETTFEGVLKKELFFYDALKHKYYFF
jgi:hypothetical protein